MNSMEIGYRVIRQGDLGAAPLSFVQISLWKTADWGVADGEQAVQDAIEMAAECRRRGIRYVFHPLEYPLTGEQAEETLSVFRRLAKEADYGIIIHDEGRRDGGRLEGKDAETYEGNVRELGGICGISIENAFNSQDAAWFWERFVVQAPRTVSLTIDIGHLESAGVDSPSFISSLPDHVVDRIAFVHMHHKGEERYGVIDHWPLEPGCRELEAMQVLLGRKKGLRVILELDSRDRDGIARSIELLRAIR